MIETLKLPSLWQTIQHALGLDQAIFTAVQQAPEGLWLAGMIVCLAGLSEAVGQSIVLLINRVRFKRFVLALLIATISHFVGYLLWTTTVWLVGGYLFERTQPWLAIASVVGLAYAPQLLAFFTLTPFIGNPFSILLSLWSLLAIVVALRAGLGLETWQAIVTSGLGWLLIQTWKRTVGRPVYALGRWLQRRAAGVPLEFTSHDVSRLRRRPYWLENLESWKSQRPLIDRHQLVARLSQSGLLLVEQILPETKGASSQGSLKIRLPKREP